MNLDQFEKQLDELQTDRDFSRLDEGKFDINRPPEKPVAVLSLCGQGISTAGNLTVFQAQLKSAKSTAILAATTSIMSPTGDCLGFTGISTGGAWVHFDTEQSPYDFHRGVRTALRRAGLAAPPDWARFYSTVHFDLAERREMLFAELERAYNDFGRISGVSVDGIADLCQDPNDPDEAFALVSRLQRTAVQYGCPIIVSVHENPGADNRKTRGHLGSELARKAETNLQLVKDADGISTMYSERSRSVYIPKAGGHRFAWDDAARMHLSCRNEQEGQRNSAAQNHYEAAVGIFGNDPSKSLSWSELMAALEPLAGSKKNAENRIRAMKKCGAIRFEFKRYWLSNP